MATPESGRGPDPGKDAARRAARLRRLGPDPACVLCGVASPECLTLAPRSLIERHHPAGRANDPATAPLCLNCHRIATEGQVVAGLDFGAPPTLLHQLAAILAGLAAFFALLAERLGGYAAALGALVDSLDTELPPWRGLPGARPVEG